MKSKIPILNKPRWRPICSFSQGGELQSFTVGNYIDQDHRGRDYADPYRYMTTGLTGGSRYNTFTDSWGPIPSPALSGTYGQGHCQAFAPTQGPKGTLAAGATTTSVVLSTALPTSVGVNQLADRGDNKGFIIRIIGNAGGSSGKIEERRVVANSSGTTPTLYLDAPLSFTPANGDAYEFLSGRVYYLTTGAATAGMWKYYDILTCSMSGNLSVTNLPTISAVWNEMVALDEAHVPYNRFPGEGFIIDSSKYYDTLSVYWIKNCLQATATAAGTLTGQSSSGDASVLANEYRNFQIRIVEDTTTPTAVGQRRRISSHTAGTSPVYTLSSSWSVTPSSTCKYVLENDNDKLLLWTSGSTTTYNYNHTANTWNTTTWAVRPAAMTNGPSIQQFGLNVHEDFINGIDPAKGQRNSYILSFRGNSTLTFDLLDIAGAATGSWTSALNLNPSNTTIFQNSTSLYSQWAYNNHSDKGRYIYVFSSNSSTVGNLSMVNRIDLYTRNFTPYSSSNAVSAQQSTASASIGNRAMKYMRYDAINPIVFVAFGKIATSTNTDFYELMII